VQNLVEITTDCSSFDDTKAGRSGGLTLYGGPIATLILRILYHQLNDLVFNGAS